MNIVSIFTSLLLLLSFISLVYILIDLSTFIWDTIDANLLVCTIDNYVSQHVTGEKSYVLKIVYKYSYNGKEYQSGRVNLSNNMRSKKLSSIESLRDEYVNVEKKVVKIKVCNIAPFLSVVVPGSSNIPLLSFFFIFGLTIAVMMHWVNNII